MAMFVMAIIVVEDGDRHNGAAFFLAVAAIILFHLEVCPKCNRLVWREGEGSWTFYAVFPIKAFWIGLECREHTPEPVEKTE